MQRVLTHPFFSSCGVFRSDEPFPSMWELMGFTSLSEELLEKGKLDEVLPSEESGRQPTWKVEVWTWGD